MSRAFELVELSPGSTDPKRHFDSLRLDRLSDPKFVFKFTIKSDLTVRIVVRCKAILNELNIISPGRYECPKCETSFKFPLQLL